ncbi:hypothetical protein ACAG96_00170 [Candidatus Izemoplasma sp. B36]|uniref:hypothetical protein n=1 Tax=Candidatus Izemoplasma sp. B36 TaxID=3242468 RepID=UPI0035566F3B
MKKKLFLVLLMTMVFTLTVSCDLLSSLQFYTGFAQEYQEFADLYANPSQYTVLTETELTIDGELTNIDTMVPLSSRVYFMMDMNSDFLYVEQNLDGPTRKSLYHDAGDLYIEYLIDDDNVVTALLPEEDDRFDRNTNADFVNENFSVDSIQNESSQGDRTYEFDVALTQAINLEALGGFLDEILQLDDTLGVLDDCLAHVVVSFASENSRVEVNATVENYTINFEGDQTVVFSLTNHTVVMIPEDFAFPALNEAPYQFVAPNDVALANVIYNVDDQITYPADSDQSGYIQIDLPVGEFAIESSGVEMIISATLFDNVSIEVPIVVEDIMGTEMLVFEITEAGTYYLFVTASEAGQVDLTITQVGGTVDTETTTEVVTTEVPTTLEETTVEETTTETPAE